MEPGDSLQRHGEIVLVGKLEFVLEDSCRIFDQVRPVESHTGGGNEAPRRRVDGGCVANGKHEADRLARLRDCGIPRQTVRCVANSNVVLRK